MKKITLFLFLITLQAQAKQTNDGRFQLIQLSDMRRDQFLLDTHTGNVWSASCFAGSASNCEYTAFKKMDVEGISASLKEIISTANRIENTSKKPE